MKISEMVAKAENRFSSDPKSVRVGLTEKGKMEIAMHDNGQEGTIFRYLDARGASTLSEISEATNIPVQTVRAILRPYSNGVQPLIQVS